MYRLCSMTFHLIQETKSDYSKIGLFKIVAILASVLSDYQYVKNQKKSMEKL